VRPVKPFGTLLLGDIRYPDGRLMRPWDIVGIELGRARPHPPHYEDVEADFVRHRPELRGRMEEGERREFLESVADEHPEAVWRSKERSLTIFRPSEVAASFSFDRYSEKYEARLWWPGCGSAEGLPVTDLKWRALGRRLTTEGPAEQRLDEADLRRLLGYETLYLAAGLSRSFEGEYWPLVVAVHTVPDYEATIDERHL
jgi:putative nucleic acid modification protein with dual OB domain